MTETNQDQKTVAIQTIYVKDVSFEAPNSPGVFMEENIVPETKINLSNTHNKIGENSYDVSLTIKAEASYGEKTMFIAEVEQSAQGSGEGGPQLNTVNQRPQEDQHPHHRRRPRP